MILLANVLRVVYWFNHNFSFLCSSTNQFLIQNVSTAIMELVNRTKNAGLKCSFGLVQQVLHSSGVVHYMINTNKIQIFYCGLCPSPNVPKNTTFWKMDVSSLRVEGIYFDESVRKSLTQSLDLLVHWLRWSLFNRTAEYMPPTFCQRSERDPVSACYVLWNNGWWTES